ncbi:ferredoxin [Alterinioella nitratireducens]|uniref:ferredoxin n=1 Tax=Alterinioella nitratireducens TaxID=2735915 RepID=UPI004058918C
MTYDDIRRRAAGEGLTIFGGFHPVSADACPDGTVTMLLFAPEEPGFWPRVAATPEFQDEAPDPLDRWSTRVIGALAETAGGRALFPFGGPPYLPFIAWATRTGRAWPSPVGMLVHDRAGLMISIRGAIALPYSIDLPATGPRPCETCAAPCRSACPVDALGPDGYDVVACHAYLDTDPGRDCMELGCKARRACPLSAASERVPAQSAYHMRQFHK